MNPVCRVIADIRHLIEKCPDGLEGYNGEAPTEAGMQDESLG